MRVHGTITDVDPVARYLRDLDGRLVGPGRVRRGLVAEAADHLDDAAEAYARAGLDRADAARMAVADFGTLDEVAPAFQTTLAVASARRAAWLLIAILSVQPMLWDRGLMLGVDDGAATPSGTLFTLLDHAVEYGGTLTVAVAVLCLLATGVGHRWHHAGRAVARSTAFFTLGVCALLPLLASSIVWTVGAAGSGAKWGYMTVLLFLPLAVVARSARRCLAAAA